MALAALSGPFILFDIQPLAANITILLYLSSVYASDALEGNAILDCDKRIIVETIPGEYNNNQLHPPNPLQFDPSNPTTITCGTPRTISVLDGCPPFNWSVSGTGYTLTDVPGNERSKILNCSGGT